MLKYYCVKDGESTRTHRKYYSGFMYDGHDMNHETLLVINIMTNIGDLVKKSDFISLAEWREKQIDEIFEDD